MMSSELAALLPCSSTLGVREHSSASAVLKDAGAHFPIFPCIRVRPQACSMVLPFTVYDTP